LAAAATEGAYPPGYPAPKRRTGLIVAIVVGCLVVVSGGCRPGDRFDYTAVTTIAAVLGMLGQS
jgi:hypothetical protein